MSFSKVSSISRLILFFFLFWFGFNAKADTLGQDQLFFISPQYDAQSRATTTGTLRYVSEQAYFYVASDYWTDIGGVARGQALVQIENLAREFDRRIYPIETRVFGSEPSPGIDNDSRITILLTPLIEGAGGYFDSTNQYLSSRVPNSNQREMIYLNVGELADQNKMNAFLAHEFQHLISFNQKEKLRNVFEDIWINELRSEYAITLLGYNDTYEGSHLQRRVRALLNDPSDSLTEWKNFSPDYGQIGLFGEYLAEHWSPQVVVDTIKNNLVSIPSTNEALIRNNYKDIFLNIYREWLIALILNDTSVNARFGFTRNGLKDFHVTPTKAISNLADNAVLTISDVIKDWQGRWYEVLKFTPSQKNSLKISFSSPSLTSFIVSYIVFKNDNSKVVGTFNPSPGSSALYMRGAGTDFNKIVIMPIKKDKLSGFLNSEPGVTLTTSFERVDSIPSGSSLATFLDQSLSGASTTPPSSSSGDSSGSTVTPSPSITPEPLSNIPDGSLIMADGDYRVYVIKGRWRRHIASARIFNFYPGLGFDRVIRVSPDVLNQYRESSLIRSVGGKRVYSVDGAGSKHWLNMSGEQFGASGRSWESIFEVNASELNFYRIGSNLYP